MTVVMGEGGGGSNVVAMEDAHRWFATCFSGCRGCRLETSVPRVCILKPKQEVRGKGAGGCAKSKARSCSLKVARARALSLSLTHSLSLPPPLPPPPSLSRPQATRTLSLVASRFAPLSVPLPLPLLALLLPLSLSPILPLAHARLAVSRGLALALLDLRPWKGLRFSKGSVSRRLVPLPLCLFVASLLSP